MFKKLLIVIMILFIVSCSGITGQKNGLNNEYEKYFSGIEGVDVTIDEMPSTIYYYDEPGNAYNEFELSLRVENKGASFARGATYISGYNPNLIQFEEMPIGPGGMGSCGLSISSLGFGSLGGMFQCDGVQLGVGGNGNFYFGVDSLKSLVQSINNKFPEANWWIPENFDIGVDASQINGQNLFNLHVNDIAGYGDIEYLGHGRLFIALFSGIDFTRTHGREYLLAGDTYEYPGGEEDYFLYHGHLLQTGWPPGLDYLTQKLLVTNCYFYTTYASPVVCIDPNPNSGKDKVCTPTMQSWSNSQGAPVAITSVEQENTPKKAIFHINIQNVGKGDVFDPGKLEKCSPYLNSRLRSEDKNIVYVGDVRIGMTRLSNCVPDGIVRLKNGRGTITCTYPYEYLDIASGYTTPLVVELWYGYSDTQERSFKIKRVS